jgi:hypothetical protein
MTVKRKISKIEQYCNVMEEVKKRDLVIRGFLAGRCSTAYKATNLECVCLQVRKILELIALGSLVVNKEEFSKYHVNFHKYWHGGRILKDIERINPKFYPVPIKEESSSAPKIKAEWKNVTEGYLTKDDFTDVYEKCGKILHADNPFGSKTDYSYYESQVTSWMSKIIRLLSTHVIHLLKENIYVIHMREERDDKVHGYIFAPTDPKSAGKNMDL